MDESFVFQPKMSRFCQNIVRDPRSQDADFLKLCATTLSKGLPYHFPPDSDVRFTDRDVKNWRP